MKKLKVSFLGYPGWHIECSAMSSKYLGQPFDIHTGGEDHISIHHTNEIAQSEAANGKKFVNYWLHGAFLLFKGEKVSKSKGGLYTISELQDLGYEPLDFRYLALQTHYKKPLNFTLENLDAAKAAFDRLKRKIIELKTQTHKGKDLSKPYEPSFLKAINSDLNISLALQIFQKALDDFEFDPKLKLKTLEKFDQVLGLGVQQMQEQEIKIPSDIKQLIERREGARKKKNFAESDSLREIIKEKGFLIEDSPKGPILRKA